MVNTNDNLRGNSVSKFLGKHTLTPPLVYGYYTDTPYQIVSSKVYELSYT